MTRHAHIEWIIGVAVLRFYENEGGFERRERYTGAATVVLTGPTRAEIRGLHADRITPRTRLSICRALHKIGVETLDAERGGRKVTWDVESEIERHGSNA